MLSETNKPYSWEQEFYLKNNIPQWECETHKKLDLGKIYQSEDGGYVKATVCPMPSQFWEFEVYSAECEKIFKINTGSGTLEDYFSSMRLISEGMIGIESMEEKK